MRRSRLLDRGHVTLLIYPEVTVVSDRGVPIKVASDTPVVVRAITTEDRSSDAELAGQVTARVIRCQARSAPVGSWAKVELDGEEYDVAIPPRVSPGTSRAMRHVEFTIRSRNNLQGER